ncbi:MAG: tRNA (guanosine(46)-N7)-methyltransferase TrmB [Flavobacteriales bacterium]|nr:tRNA (guanosine(46)-N7)-methyltransferase TrmB [Flavobacteriales bacterium]
MMAKNKLQRFSEIRNFNNVIEINYDVIFNNKTAGCWQKDIFKNNNPIVLELACGKGEYTIGLAKKNPNKNYIGIDIKGERIWKGAKDAIDLNLDNVRFLRTRIEHLNLVFSENEVSEIWITFPDPFLKKSKSRKRLTSLRFLEIYKQILSKKSFIHLKTDSQELYEYTLDVLVKNKLRILENLNDITKNKKIRDLDIKTYYEKKFNLMGKSITYIKFMLNNI